jgi:uncharacterized protein
MHASSQIHDRFHRRSDTPQGAARSAPTNPLADCRHVAGRSRLLRVRGRNVVEDPRTGVPAQGRVADLARRLPDFVFGSDHPCVMARSALQRGAVRVGVHEAFGGLAAAVTCHDLYECLAQTSARADAFVSYAAMFPDAVVADEAEFEDALWRHLQAMHEVDRRYFAWAPEVASDPRDAKFSFSVGGRAWYVIGLHPRASRLARRFPVPALVFNPHAQFEKLRADGRYETLRDRIRERDAALQGSVNPMLADHGRESEAKQYSGRAVDGTWRCPFVPGATE